MRELLAGKNVSAILSEIRGLFDVDAELWFRGQSKFLFLLVPGIFRQGPEFGCAFSEARMYHEFVRRHPAHSTRHRTVYEWLTLMQHYGLPTRLLDWTTNLLVGLFFACNKDRDDDGALYAFDARRLAEFDFNPLMEIQVTSESPSEFYRRLIYNNAALDDDALINGHRIAEIKADVMLQVKFTHLTEAKKNPLKSIVTKVTLSPTLDVVSNRVITSAYSDVTRALSNIISFVPPVLNNRLRRQHGVFTFHGGAYFDGRPFIEYGAIESHPYLEDLVKVRVTAAQKESLLSELALSGISEATLFPEMEYQAMEIKRRFTRPI